MPYPSYCVGFVKGIIAGVHADQAMFPAMNQRNDSKECASPVNRLSE
jgi:hypothetical protein